MTAFKYPASPTTDVKQLTKVSPNYRKHVFRVLLSILVFILAYLGVLVLSFFLIYWGGLLALGVLTFKAGWFTLIAAAGIMIVVIMFFVFMIKFMFKIKKDEDKNRVELTKAEHPNLFEFIEKVCDETKAPHPHKIVVSPAVNASVYYTSSFLSMFFPVRKNLEIGLGLVSGVNMTEFKAIFAHEFGHFSQSSTRLGSYVYRFNRMIHNLLYDNEGWNNTLNAVTSINALLSLFGKITVELVNLVLRFFVQLYKLINITYLSLSREMEFHADSVAISVTGNQPIISALYRLEFTQEAYNYTLHGIANYKKDEVSYPENFFSLLERSIQTLAKLNHLPIENHLPIITTSTLIHQNLDSRIQYKNIWASHPSTADREKNANRSPLEAEIIIDSPWSLFSNPVDLQKKLSKYLTELEVKNRDTFSNSELIAYFQKIETEGSLNSVYKDFYTYAGNVYAVPNEENKSKVLELSVEDLFSDTEILKLKRFQKNIYDRELMKSISEGHTDIKRFEFDGKKYTRYYSAELYQQLKKETEQDEEVIKKHVQTIADWFYFKTEKTAPHLADHYKSLTLLRQKVTKDRKSLTAVFDGLARFYREELNRDRSIDDLPELREKLSNHYKTYLGVVAAVEDLVIPDHYGDELIPRAYKEKVFNEVVEDPLKEKKLDGFNPFVNSLKVLMENCEQLDQKLHKSMIRAQDKSLELLSV